MNSNNGIPHLRVKVDMAGCPNRCRHCWLGSHKNGCISTEEFKRIANSFKNYRNNKGNGIAELSFFSWWREPDYRDDYRELWQLEQELSSHGLAMRFELLSVWRLARDETYAKWAAALPTKACQITFFGMEENTDWGMRRKGAFKDNLIATHRLIEVGIAPRWQLFLTKRCMGELNDFLKLIFELNLHKQCEAIGKKFEFFIGGMTPEGNGYELEPIRIDKSDLQLIPKGLTDMSRDGTSLTGKPENELIDELLKDNSNIKMDTSISAIAVNADFDVYPNIAEPTQWWKLGNLKVDGVDRVLSAYYNGRTPGMTACKNLTPAQLAACYGNKNSNKLYDKNDLISRFMHEWGIDYEKENN